MQKILIVDDEMLIRQLVVKYAKIENILVDEAENGLEAINKCKEIEYDLVIMDIMMPVLDGFSAVKEIRKTSSVPIIMLSSRSEEYDKIYGFDLGIDDYVTKPFSVKELLLRVKAIINRTNYHKKEVLKEQKTFSYQDLLVNFDNYEVSIGGVRLELTKKEFHILSLLLENVNQAVTREELLSKVWGNDFDGDDRTLDTHMKSLRKKLASYGDNIITKRRVGYRFDVK